MNIKEGKTVVSYRGPTEVVGWLEKRADYNGATISAEISSAVRDKMEREREAQAAKARALASAGAA
jgi:regulator of protease activity HflC (stomatin/prohibitin superfamily)